MLSEQRIVSLVFLGLATAYTVLAGDIQLYPGDEFEKINAQTFPKAIGYALIVLSVIHLFMPHSAEKVSWRRFDWVKVLGLLGLMVLYGFTIKSVGFLLSTTGFLVLGFLLLGERRPLILFVASFPLAAGFQFALHGVLGVYIEDPFLALFGLQ